MAKDSLVVNTYPSVAYIKKQGEVDGQEWHRGIDFLPTPERMRISIQLS
jgi:hypothetical protein